MEPTSNTTPVVSPVETSELPTIAGIDPATISLIYTQVRQVVEADYEERLKTWKATELAELEVQMDKNLQQLVQEYMEKFKAEQAPPSDADIQKLLEQEYATFNLPLRIDGEVQTLTIRELPMEVEQKFYRQFRDKMKDKLSDISSFVQRNIDQPGEKQLASFLEVFDSTFDLLADAVVLVLNWDNSNAKIDRVWVKHNISSVRQWNIIQAQIKVNRLRDFFSQLFQAGTEVETMTTGLSVQRLQQQLRK